MSSLLERVPAVRRIETDRDDAWAIELAGHISAADVENLYGLLEGAYLVHGQVDLLLRFVDHEGIDSDAIMSRTAASAGSHAGSHIRRAAMVGTPEWLSVAMSLLSTFSSVELRQFDPEDEQAAWAYIEARPR